MCSVSILSFNIYEKIFVTIYMNISLNENKYLCPILIIIFPYLILLVRVDHNLYTELIASSLVTISTLETRLRCELIRVELLWTSLDLAIPIVINGASYNHVTGEQAHL